MIQLIGPVGTLLTTISFIPQVLQVIKTKDVSGISLGMYIIFVLGVILWTFILHDITIILSNGITTVLSGIILYYNLLITKRYEGLVLNRGKEELWI